jgi:hypothetical protein
MFTPEDMRNLESLVDEAINILATRWKAVLWENPEFTPDLMEILTAATMAACKALLMLFDCGLGGTECRKVPRIAATAGSLAMNQRMALPAHPYTPIRTARNAWPTCCAQALSHKEFLSFKLVGLHFFSFQEPRALPIASRRASKP